VAASLRPALLVVVALTVSASVAGCRSAAPGSERFGALNPRLGELLLVGFHGTVLEDNADLQRLVCETRVAGVILFARNIVDAGQTARLTRDLTARARECTGRLLLVAVDAEGGRVMRLGPGAGWTATLSHQDLGQAGDVTQTELEARRIGAMLREAGINWNLAPVVDVGYNPANPVIVGVGRSFGATRTWSPPTRARSSPACTPPASSRPSSTSPATARAPTTRTQASSTSPTPRGRTSSWSRIGCCWPRASWTR